jgi:hypothetical protein
VGALDLAKTRLNASAILPTAPDFPRVWMDSIYHEVGVRVFGVSVGNDQSLVRIEPELGD